jgi:hypothetical protein
LEAGIPEGLFYYRKKINGIGWQSFWVHTGVFSEQIGYLGELVARYGIRNNQQSIMRQIVIKKLNGQANEMVSVSGNKASFFASREPELIYIGCLHHFCFMDANAINPIFPEQFGYFGT